MRKLAQVAFTLLLTATVLAGCGDDNKNGSDPKSADPSSTPSDAIEETDWGKPATGPQIAGDGYTYRIPESWADITKRARKLQASVDSAASEKAATDGFADNINTGYQTSDETLDEIEESMPAQLGGLVKDLETLPRVTVDGVESLRHRGPAVSAGTKYFLEQIAVPRDGRIAIITFSFSRDLPEKERDAVVSSVVASWKWTS